MNKMIALLLALPAAVGIASCDADRSLKLGVIAELTGDMPAVGASCRNAAQMAVDEVNAAGGLPIGGERVKLKLVVEDNAGKADQSAVAAQKLITQDEVLAIVGPNASRYAIPAAEIAESSNTVLITPWSTNPKTTLDASTGQPKKYVFRACFIDPFQGGLLARFALENLKARRAAVLYDVASDYNKGIAEVFKASYERLGGKVVAFETYTTGDKDFSAQLTKIKDTKPEVIFLPNYYSEVPLQVQQAKRLGIDVPFIGSDSWGSDELLKLGGADLNGYFFSTHYAADNAAPAARKFLEDYEKTYGAKPDDVAALTYDAFGLLFGAIQSAGKADREAVREALSTLAEYRGVTGNMQFRADSRDPVKSAVILQIQDGKFRFYANASP
ncbi:MAG: ABC transporter substrate-binding protein [Gammaproteobacteria bacterium]|jgi:branched-chain amino acid transport system substrate-binding protein|nr:ABC transporter substrate-binding protein [Gammaproteobacteria bacterium]